jgi:hypothetical protein
MKSRKNIYKARILAISSQCHMIAEVELQFAITVKRSISFTDIDIPISNYNKDWLTENLKFKNVKLCIKDEGYGDYSAKVVVGNTDFNAQLLENKIGVQKENEEVNWNR